MQRNVFLLILVGLFLLVITTISQAQVDPDPQLEANYIVIPHPLSMRENQASLPGQGEGTVVVLTPLSLTTEDPPSDFCDDATLMIVTDDNNSGGVADVDFATEEASDPVLSCMWGQPDSPRGFRTVWYRLVAPYSATVTISTFSSGYDTVLAVHRGSCNTLTTLRCNDDRNGFSSEVTVTISEGEAYYIEIADWQFGTGGGTNTQMSIFALLQPVDSKWDAVITKPAVEAVTRHAVVAQGQYLYVIGGETGPVGGLLPSNRAKSYDTINNTWVGLPEIPNSGYSNTTAALVDGWIYLPTGFSGNNSGYDGKHLRFNISGNSWVEPNAKETPKVGGAYFAWSYAVVPPTNDRYYLAGGMTTTVLASAEAGVIDNVFEYNPSTNLWEELASMEGPRYAHTAAWLEGSNHGICVAGGLGTTIDAGTGEAHAILHGSMECYQPGGAWKILSEMQIPRFGAGSAVGPDGKWYVFGGVTVRNNEYVVVAQTEVYDPASNTWTLMEAPYDLAGFDSMPPRFWPRGAMVDDILWVVGGSIAPRTEEETSDEMALPTVDRLLLPSVTVPLPIIFSIDTDDERPDDNINQARALPLGTQQTRNFDQQLDFYDFYYFDLYAQQRAYIDLTVPGGNDFDLILYGPNKNFLDSSTNTLQGKYEHIEKSLTPGRYFIAVKRIYPTSQPDKGAYYTVSVR